MNYFKNQIMKKLIFAVLTIVAFSLNTEAQGLRIGIKAGPNFANFNGGDLSYSSRTSFHAGAVAEIKILSFAIQPELLYNSQGAEVEGFGDFNLDYVSIPVMAKFYIIPDLLALEAGPQFSFLVNESNPFEDIVDDFESESFDFAVGGGASVNITKGLFASARYTVGLTEIAPDAEATNHVFQISVGYMFL